MREHYNNTQLSVTIVSLRVYFDKATQFQGPLSTHTWADLAGFQKEQSAHGYQTAVYVWLRYNNKRAMIALNHSPE